MRVEATETRARAPSHTTEDNRYSEGREGVDRSTTEDNKISSSFGDASTHLDETSRQQQRYVNTANRKLLYH
jgi:hypothetical protein